MISVAIASCLIHPDREEYLQKVVDSIRKDLPDAEFLVAFDKKGKDLPGCTTYVHDRGLGHSWNWALSVAKHPFILQTEDDWMTEGAWSGRPSDLRDKILTGLDLLAGSPGTFLRFDNMVQPHNQGRVDLWSTDPRTKKTIYTLRKPDLAKWHESFNMYMYSNRPQLKAKAFHDLVGPYPEGVTVPQVEVLMCKAALFHPQTKVLFYAENSFIHIGNHSVRQQS